MTKFKLTRDFYRPSKDYVEYKPQIECKKVMWEIWVHKEKPIAMFFTGKQSKPNWHNKFTDNDAMKKKIHNRIDNILHWEQKKAERKEERKNALVDVKVGDLFYNSWGYEQTNLDFYQCVEKKGKTMTLRPIASKTVEGSTMCHGMADNRVAVKDAFLSDKERYPDLVKRSFSMEVGFLSKTTETEKHYCSWYY